MAGRAVRADLVGGAFGAFGGDVAKLLAVVAFDVGVAITRSSIGLIAITSPVLVAAASAMLQSVN